MQKILVIDDEELLTRTFSRLLERQGYEVYSAKRGQDALEIAQEVSFDLVICDIRMPGMDGVDTVKQLREIFESREGNHPPEIFITGYANQNSEIKAKELQPAAYILKPFDNEMLLLKIKGILST